MPASRFSVTLSPAVMSAIEARQDVPGESRDRSLVIAQIIERYDYLLAEARRRLRDELSEAELGLILDVLNGTPNSEPFTVGMLDAEIADAIRYDGQAVNWLGDEEDPTGHELVGKLVSMSYADKLALVDASERWWNRVAAGEQPALAEALR